MNVKFSMRVFYYYVGGTKNSTDKFVFPELVGGRSGFLKYHQFFR